MTNFTGAYDKDGDPINEYDVVNYKNQKHNCIVTYHPENIAFTLDDERHGGSSQRYMTNEPTKIVDGKTRFINVEIRAKQSELPS